MRVEVLEQGLALEELFVNGSGQVAHPVNAVFPIFQFVPNEPWIPLGTGFFIASNGLFVTAKHVLTDRESGELLDELVGIHVLRDRGLFGFRRIVGVQLHNSADVAVGFLEDSQSLKTGVQTINHSLLLTKRIPQANDKVVTFAIPKPTAGWVEGGMIELTFAPRLIQGVIEEHYPDGRDRILMPSHCFQTSMELQGGASGGPVFFGDGFVFGVNSTGFDGTPVSFVSSITDILSLLVRNVGLASERSLRSEISMQEIADEGYIQIR